MQQLALEIPACCYDLGVGACRLWLPVRRIFLVNCTSLWAPHDKRCRECDESCEMNCEDDKVISSWGLWSREERVSLFTCSQGLSSSAANSRSANKVSCPLNWIPVFTHSWGVAGKTAAWIFRERSYFLPSLECLVLNRPCVFWGITECSEPLPPVKAIRYLGCIPPYTKLLDWVWWVPG